MEISELMQYSWIIGPVIGVIVLLFVFRVFRSFFKGQAQTAKILQTGTPAAAKILALQPTGASMTVGGHRQPQVLLSVEVHPPGGAAFQMQFPAFISEFQIPQVQPGAVVQIRYNPANPAEAALAAVGGTLPDGTGANGPVAIPVQSASQPVKMPLGAIIGLVAAAVGVGVAIYVSMVNVGGFGLDSKEATGVCGQAVMCCEKVTEKSGNAESKENCKNLKKVGVPESACQTSLDGFKKSAEALGITCD